jgi:glycosyltransferase involved in cell wall biosynthesis
LFYQYDTLFASSTPLTVGIPGIFAKWIRGKKFVFEVRDLWPELPKAMGVIKNPFVLWLMGILEYLCYHSADKLIGLSGGISNGIAKRGINISKIATIPNGCDLDVFQTQSERFYINGVNESDFLCLYSGTHGIANGLDIVIDVARILHDSKNNSIKFILVGDGRCKPNLINRARKEGIQNVIFLDPINKRDLSRLMSTCDIGMQLLANVPAFYYGTSPNKFFDYLSVGLPVLNNYPGWIADMIRNHNCGVVVSANNPSDFSEKLIHLEKEKYKLPELSANAKALAINEFDRDKLSKKWVEWVTDTN